MGCDTKGDDMTSGTYPLFDKLTGDYAFYREQSDLMTKVFPEGQRILSLGDGFGNVSRMLATRCSVVDVDIDNEACRYIRKKDGKIAVVRGNVHYLPFADSAFDGAVCPSNFGVFQERKFLYETARVLRIGALLSVTGFNREKMQGVSVKNILPELERRARRVLSEEELWILPLYLEGVRERFECMNLEPSIGEVMSLLKSAGFSIQDTSSFHRGYNWHAVAERK